jgi:hypothetical protein
MKAQTPEVSDDHVTAQAIKALHVGPLHSHLVREWPKTVPELYNNSLCSSLRFNTFASLSSREKFQSQMKPQNLATMEASAATLRPHNIDYDGCGTPENWEKNYGTPSQQTNQRSSDQRFTQYSQRGGSMN